MQPQRQNAMAKRRMQEYQKLSADDQRTFDRWLKANTVVGAILSVLLVAMAWIGSNHGAQVEVAKAMGSKSINMQARTR
jgi:hypothetical protein